MTTQTRPAATRPAIPALNNYQMQEIFRLMVEDFGLGHSVMVENAGRVWLNLARRLVGGTLAGQTMVLLAGAGNCGASGLVTARYLVSAGADLTVVLARPVVELDPQAAHQCRLLARVGASVYTQASLPSLKLAGLLRQSVLILDALLGGGLHGWPTGAEAFLIQIARQAGPPVLSLDLPSGLGPDGDLPVNPQLILPAAATMALGLPRLAHVQPTLYSSLGDLYLADLGIPTSLYARLGLTVGPIFQASDLLLLRRAPKMSEL